MKQKKSLPAPPPMKVPSIQGKPPPHATDLEYAVLGALMIDKNAVSEAVPLLKPEFFYVEEHQVIFKAIQNLVEKKAPIDLLMVSNELKRMDRLDAVGGDYYLVGLTQKVASSAHIEFHSRIIVQQYILRMLIIHGRYLIDQAYHHDPDVFTIIDNTKKYFEELYKETLKGQKNSDNDFVTVMEQKVARQNAGKAVGVPTGSDAVDNFLGGWFLGELYIIAGRPGMGKTTYALISAWNAAQQGHYVIFFSFEMPRNQLVSKLASMLTGIDYQAIKKGKLTNEELQRVIQASKIIDQSKLIIEAGIKTIEDVREKMEEHAKMFKIRAVFFDYIQRCVSRQKMETRHLIVLITRELKTLAKEFNIAMIALSQLSRSVETRNPPRPILKDLKESSSIEEDADIVAFLYRQAYYDEQQGMLPGYSEQFHVEFIVGKGRDTGTHVIHLFMDPIRMFIENYRIDGNYG